MKSATTIIVAAVAGLMALGMVMLYSVGMAQAGERYLLLQLTWAGLGLGACVFATMFDYRKLKPITVAVPLLVVTMILLVLVLIPGIGIERNRATRWIDLGSMNFQPSELAKLTVIIALAAYGTHFRTRMKELKYGLLVPGGVLAVLLYLIYREPDYSTMALLAATSGIVLMISGASWKHALPVALTGFLLFGYKILSSPMRMERIRVWLNPEYDKLDKGYQIDQGILAMGNGGLFGVGLGNGQQKNGFVPEPHTDMIFTMIGEELGVVTLLVVATLMVILICGLYISWKSGDRFGQLLGCGITFLICLQAFINIGVVTRLLPNTGIPLPFISYGGSSLVFMLASLGLLLSIANYSTEPIHADNIDNLDDLSVEER